MCIHKWYLNTRKDIHTIKKITNEKAIDLKDLLIKNILHANKITNTTISKILTIHLMIIPTINSLNMMVLVSTIFPII